MTSKVQTSMVMTLARTTAERSSGGAAPSSRGTARTRRATPPPWSPSASSAFSRPPAPPLAPAASLDTFAKGLATPSQRSAMVEGRSTVATVGALRASAAGKPAPADVPPPPVGAPRKPSPETLPPPPGIVATKPPVRASAPTPPPVRPVAPRRSLGPALVVPVALGREAEGGSVVMVTAVSASRLVPTVQGAAGAVVEVASAAVPEPVGAVVEAKASPGSVTEVVEMAEAIASPVPVAGVAPIKVPEPVGAVAEVVASPGPVVEVAPIAVPEPVVPDYSELASPILELEPAPEPVAVEDSVPVIVPGSAAPVLGRGVELAPPRLASVIVGALPSTVPTLEAPILTNLVPAQHGSAAARPRRRLGLVLGAAASLLLAVGIAAASSDSPRTEPRVARDGAALASDLAGSASALALAWTSRSTPTPAPTPSPVVPPTTEPGPAESELLALAVATPIEVATPELEPTPQPRRSRRARSRAQAPAIVAVEATEAPAPAPERASSRKARPVSAAKLLREGEVALALGDAKEAYRLAKRSHDTGAKTDAASLMARSACRIGERNDAKRALRELPLLERGAVRRDCRRSGSRIGL